MPRTPAERSLAKLSDYQKTFSTPHGERVLWDIMKYSNILSGFKGPSEELQFREGERFQALRILTILKTTPAQILKRIEENTEENNS